MPPKGNDDDSPFGPLRPNAPVSVIKAAKASLKEPTRPHTPADLQRGLFTSAGDPSQRPNSSYGIPTSKNFFESSPKLGLNKLDVPPGRAEHAGPRTTSLLGSGDRSSAGTPSPSRLHRSPSLEHSTEGSPPPTSVAALRSNSSSRMKAATTPAETVAALKAGMAVGLEPNDFYFEDEAADEERCDIDDDIDGSSRRRNSGPGPASSSMMKPSLHGGAQVLDMMQLSDDDEDDEANDAAYRHMYTYCPPEAPPEPATSGAAGGPAKKAPGSAERPGVPLPPSTPSAAAQAAAAAAAAAKALAASDLSDPFLAWRAAVETTLTSLAAAATAAASSKEGSPALLEQTSVLCAHVDYLRKQEHSSKWLKAPSTILDTNGRPVTMREAISEHVYRLMDFSSTELLLKACGIVLRVVKSRQPLLQASKLLYRLSKDTSNDAAFRREGILEPIVRTVHVCTASTSSRNSSSNSSSSSSSNFHEPLVYLNGCLKNASNDASNQKALVKIGALGVLSQLLTLMSSHIDTPSRVGTPAQGASPPPLSESPSAGGHEFTLETAGQVAVQVTGVLRNLAVSSSHTPAFLTGGVLPALRATARALSTHAEVVLNIGRILSKLSLQADCQAAMEADREYAPLLVRLLGRYADNRAILLRISFVMGNLTANRDEYRHQISMVPGSLATIISILHLYALGADARPDTPISATNSSRVDRLARAATRQDCLIKILRLAANLAINAEAGPQLAENYVVADSLLKLMDAYNIETAEELILNCVCALTNFSFYHTPTNKVLLIEPSEILRHVTPLLMCENEEAMVEAARAYGNFSRIPASREYMLKARVLEALIILLDHSNRELLYSVTGTLINFTADPGLTEILVGMGCVARLMEVLERVATAPDITAIDVSLLIVVLKALYNLCADDTTVCPIGTLNLNEEGGEGSEGKPPAAASTSSSLSEDEINMLSAILDHVRDSAPMLLKACPEGSDVIGLCDQLDLQLERLNRVLESDTLEPI